jgi:hypothetical protein
MRSIYCRQQPSEPRDILSDPAAISLPTAVKFENYQIATKEHATNRRNLSLAGLALSFVLLLPNNTTQQIVRLYLVFFTVQQLKP